MTEEKSACQHKWQENGKWDAADRATSKLVEGGPIVKCVLCGEKRNIKWEEWNSLPENQKILFNK